MSMSAQEERRVGVFDLARATLVAAHKLMDEACELMLTRVLIILNQKSDQPLKSCRKP